ncbi:tyrosine-type recombinase/integrase [Chryseobacterium sp. POL2]|uniref:tyrosine-type recombinase/integrase n=1 Tax=Chryseobacterium sp. POL2 TaxID=2713414 RepID=UPI0013E1954F|nr:tyrosine-type recombinase/integrase [Chryseobacterium sp. POL2]QIG88346.1 tyrosine-type recombinase/integrase [Chryseobacterium sp. POL2]
MATVSYLYRSTKPIGFLTVRVTFRLKSSEPIKGFKDVYEIKRKNGPVISEITKEKNRERYIKDVVLVAATKIEVEKHFYLKQYNSKSKDSSIQKRQAEISQKENELRIFLTDEISKYPLESINTDWLKATVGHYYSPKEKIENSVPQDLYSFLQFYADDKAREFEKYNSLLEDKSMREKNPITLRKKLKTIQKKVLELQNLEGRPILIRDVNVSFKNRYFDYCMSINYAYDTIKKDLGFIRSCCYKAESLGMEISNDVADVKIKNLTKSIEDVYLSFSQLDKIRDLELKTEDLYLDKYRDWCIISCYSGQRISDFLRFENSMIENDIIYFIQEKTKKKIAVPLHPEIKRILEKYDNDFPPKVSDQKYNKYVKEVCRLAGFTQLVRGRKKIKNEEDQFRSVTKDYEFCELVSGHTGRRSFATNYYGKMPTSYIRLITGHSSEKQLLEYLKKADADISKDIANYF